jgi:hypothetical protein
MFERIFFISPDDNLDNCANDGISLESLLAVRAEGYAALRFANATVQSLAVAIEELDATLFSASNVPTSDRQLKLRTACRKLAALLGIGVAQ